MVQRRMGSGHNTFLEVREDPDGDIFISVGQIGGDEQRQLISLAK